ncbi:DUF3617 domain-containing protein [Arenimonas terrae]|uniref:DUF3617 domain-containing protein n=1 Tax=Arenimonas terrae TaxID=2546226 RepID=UPI00159EDDBD|nr:DUF3617 domain-containing protein [Arenimonas terrae]
MKPIRPLSFLALVLGVSVAGAVLAQAGTGNLYSVTTKMEMQGMPFAMPANTVQVCGPKDQASDKMVPADENCTVSNFRNTGNKSSFTMVCRGENPMTATGEFERLSADAYRGRMQMKGEMEGEPMDMTMTFEGKKIRDCNYATESPEAQGRAMLAKTCEEQLRMPAWQAYESFAGPNAVCASFKPRYCSAMLAASLKPDFIRNADYTAQEMAKHGAQGPTLWTAFQACGTTRPAALAKTCPMAEKTRDYVFITGYCPTLVAKACAAADPAKDYEFVIRSCPAQAQAAAGAHCAGRDFTAMRMSPYANFCSQYAAGSLQQRNAGSAGSAAPGARPAAVPAPKPEEPAAKPSWRDRLKSAKDKLTGG